MPPIPITRFTQISIESLFKTVFKAIRRDLEKGCREKCRFNKMTADVDAKRKGTTF